MYFVNEFAVRLMMITVLLSLPKMRKIARGLYQKWVDLENNDGKFYLICQLEDTPVNKASTRNPGAHVRKTLWTLSLAFHPRRRSRPCA